MDLSVLVQILVVGLIFFAIAYGIWLWLPLPHPGKGIVCFVLLLIWALWALHALGVLSDMEADAASCGRAPCHAAQVFH